MKRQDVNVQVVNVIGGRSSIGFFGALMIFGLVLWLWKFFLVATVLIIVGAVFVDVCRRIKRDRIAILQRADLQHHWAMEGDPRGTYGGDMYRKVSSTDWWKAHSETPGPGRKPPVGPLPKPPSERIRIVGGESVVRNQSRGPCPKCLAFHDLAVTHE